MNFFLILGLACCAVSAGWYMPITRDDLEKPFPRYRALMAVMYWCTAWLILILLAVRS